MDRLTRLRMPFAPPFQADGDSPLADFDSDFDEDPGEYAKIMDSIRLEVDSVLEKFTLLQASARGIFGSLYFRIYGNI